MSTQLLPARAGALRPSFSGDTAPSKVKLLHVYRHIHLTGQRQSDSKDVYSFPVYRDSLRDTRDVIKGDWLLLGEVRVGQLIGVGDAVSTTSRSASDASYPRWIEVASGVSLAALSFGAVLMFWNTTAGAAIAGVGALGVWIFGSAASQYRSSRRGLHGNS